MIASWPGPDPAIHVYRRPPGVDARIKSGHDDLGVSEGGWHRRSRRAYPPKPSTSIME